jgi:hypothetical protein
MVETLDEKSKEEMRYSTTQYFSDRAINQGDRRLQPPAERVSSCRSPSRPISDPQIVLVGKVC